MPPHYTVGLWTLRLHWPPSSASCVASYRAMPRPENSPLWCCPARGRIIQCAQCARAREAHWRPHRLAVVKIVVLKFVIEVWLKCIEMTTTKKGHPFLWWKTCGGPNKTKCTLWRDIFIRPWTPGPATSYWVYLIGRLILPFTVPTYRRTSEYTSWSMQHIRSKYIQSPWLYRLHNIFSTDKASVFEWPHCRYVSRISS